MSEAELAAKTAQEAADQAAASIQELTSAKDKAREGLSKAKLAATLAAENVKAKEKQYATMSTDKNVADKREKEALKAEGRAQVERGQLAATEAERAKEEA